MNIVKYPLSTEKNVRLMESENKLVFAVDKKTTKKQIKDYLETSLKIKILSIKTLIGPDSRKKAYVKLSPETQAIDIAAQLGLM